MMHAIRTQQAHQHHPYQPSPTQQTTTTSPPAHHEFPPPPPPPPAPAAPVTPTATSFKHRPTHSTPPAPPPTIPFPNQATQPGLLAPHRHSLGRQCPPRTSRSRRVGVAGLPIFDVYPWLLDGRLHGPHSQPRQVLWAYPHKKHCRVRIHHPFAPRHWGQTA